jgi:flagellar basal-body rod modification protein FlgD
MTTPIPSAASTVTSTAATTVERKDQGSQKDMFLKLLVAQMKYQDPANPASSSEFMAQTATFTQVEKLEEIAAQNASMLALQRSSSAGALVGRTVSYTDEAGHRDRRRRLCPDGPHHRGLHQRLTSDCPPLDP